MPVAEGFFVDWDGNARNTLDPGGGYVCETDPVARYVAITTEGGTLVYEGTSIKRSPTSKRPASKHRLSLDHTHGAGRTKDSESAARWKGDPDMLPTTILVDRGAPPCRAPKRRERPQSLHPEREDLPAGREFGRQDHPSQCRHGRCAPVS